MAFSLFSSAFSVSTIAIEIEQSESPVILPKALLEGAEKLPAEKIDAAVLQAVKKSGEVSRALDQMEALRNVQALPYGALMNGGGLL